MESFLASIATDVSVAEFVRASVEHPEWMPTRAPLPAAAPMPTEDLDAILAGSGLSPEDQGIARREAQDPSLGVRIALHDAHISADLVTSMLTTKEAATLLGRDPSNIRRGVHEGRYYAVRVAGALRLPQWQFIEQTTYDDAPGEDVVPDVQGVPLPNLASLVSRIPTGLHPRTIEGFMHTDQPELDDHSPIEWLTGGGDPVEVGTLVAGLAYQ